MLLKTKKNTRNSEQKLEALAILTQEETVRINCLVPKSLRSDMKIFAIQHNITVTDLIISAVKHYMEQANND